MTTLEDRYRRLLALYPAEHRRLFGDEMLGVLMSGAGEGQRSPRLGESADLMWHALWRRVGGVMRPRAHGHWALAASVAGLIGSLSLFAIHLRVAAGEQVWQQKYGFDGWHEPRQTVLAGLAAMVVLAVLFGPRWLVIPLAWTLALGEAGVRYIWPFYASGWGWGDSYLVGAWTPILLGLTTAVALSARQPARGGRRLLGGRGVAALVALALVVGAWAAVDGLLAKVTLFGDGSILTVPGIDVPYLDQALPALAMLVGMAVLWWRLEGPVRRRVVVILAPSGVMYLLGTLLGWDVDYPAAWVSLSLIVLFIALCFLVLKGWERWVRPNGPHPRPESSD